MYAYFMDGSVLDVCMSKTTTSLKVALKFNAERKLCSLRGALRRILDIILCVKRKSMLRQAVHGFVVNGKWLICVDRVARAGVLRKKCAHGPVSVSISCSTLCSDADTHKETFITEVSVHIQVGMVTLFNGSHPAFPFNLSDAYPMDFEKNSHGDSDRGCTQAPECGFSLTKANPDV